MRVSDDQHAALRKLDGKFINFMEEGASQLFYLLRRSVMINGVDKTKELWGNELATWGIRLGLVFGTYNLLELGYNSFFGDSQEITIANADSKYLGLPSESQSLPYTNSLEVLL